MNAPDPVNPWNDIFARQGRVFTEVHEHMGEVVRILEGMGATTVLDLGSGTGRHVVYLARRGFSVFGLDSSPAAIQATREWLAQENLEADLRLRDMAARLPHEDGFFDAVVSIQVIHHGRAATIRRVAKEVTRVLRPGGFVFVTVPRSRNQARAFERVEENTFVPLDGPEKGLPHHYFTPAELRGLFDEFEVEDVRVDRANHYCLFGFKHGRTGRGPAAVPPAPAPEN